jgi:hypothetical protein
MFILEAVIQGAELVFAVPISLLVTPDSELGRTMFKSAGLPVQHGGYVRPVGPLFVQVISVLASASQPATPPD